MGGQTFVELQFHPPGFALLPDATSCDSTLWCSVLTIWSLECPGKGDSYNLDCSEPGNSAFVQTNGVPSLQKADLATFTPNAQTLLMSPSDKISIHMWDTKIRGGRALEVREIGHTTGKNGFMIASAKNGSCTQPVLLQGHEVQLPVGLLHRAGAEHHPVDIGHYMINSQYDLQAAQNSGIRHIWPRPAPRWLAPDRLPSANPPDPTEWL